MIEIIYIYIYIYISIKNEQEKYSYMSYYFLLIFLVMETRQVRTLFHGNNTEDCYFKQSKPNTSNEVSSSETP